MPLGAGHTVISRTDLSHLGACNLDRRDKKTTTTKNKTKETQQKNWSMVINAVKQTE